MSWYNISKNQVLSEELIRDFQNEVNWIAISEHQYLSSDFIREMQNKIIWPFLWQRINFSDDELIEFQSHIPWEHYFCYREASFSILRKFITKTPFLNMEQFKSSHLEEVEYTKIKNIIKLKNMFKNKKTSYI
jgi:hypothetical protein